MKHGSPLRDAFKLTMNSAYSKTIMKNIKVTNKYITNEALSDYFDKKYNLIRGIYQSIQNNIWLDSRKVLFINPGTVYLVLRYYPCRNVS